MSNTLNRENAILSCFLFSNDTGLDTAEAFELKSDIFTSSFRRSIAEKINDETHNEKQYSYLNFTMDGHVLGTKNEQEWIEILAQTPLIFSVSERIHVDLIKEYEGRLAKAFR